MLPRPEGIERFSAAGWAFSRAGGLVAAGGVDAAIWRVGDGQPILGVTGQGWGRIGSVAFADDERRLLALDLSYSNGHFLGHTALRSLDVATQREVGAIGIQAGLDGVFSDDGTLLALMFFGKPQVWRVEAAGVVPVRAFPVVSEEKVPLTPQFSGDKRRLAATAQQLGAYVWEIDTGALLALLDHGGASAMKLAISSDGTLVATLGDDRLLRLWRVA